MTDYKHIVRPEGGKYWELGKLGPDLESEKVSGWRKVEERVGRARCSESCCWLPFRSTRAQIAAAVLCVLLCLQVKAERERLARIRDFARRVYAQNLESLKTKAAISWGEALPQLPPAGPGPGQGGAIHPAGGAPRGRDARLPSARQKALEFASRIPKVRGGCVEGTSEMQDLLSFYWALTSLPSFLPRPCPPPPPPNPARCGAL